MSYTLAYTGAEIDALLGKIDAIFVAEYGSTIYSEVTAAIAAGNKVIVANAGKVYVYAGQDDNSGYVFTQSGPNAAKPNATYVTLSTGNVWSTATVDLATLQQFYASLMEDTASGSIASFPDGAEGVPVKELTAEIEPIQDLHGYDNPWPAGGGNNVFEPESGTVVNDDVTIVRATTGVYGISGSNSGSGPQAVRVSKLFTLKANKTYYIKGFWDGLTPSNSTCRISLNTNYYGAGLVIDELTGGSYTPTEDTQVYLFCRVAAGYTIPSGVTFKPYVTTNPDLSNWSPYSNICPISGYTGAEIPVTGINVWDEEWEQGTIDATTGANAANANAGIRAKNYIPVIQGQTYYFKCSLPAIGFRYDASHTYLGYLTLSANESFTVDNQTSFLRFRTDFGYGKTYNHDISINYPSTDTAYHSGADNTTYSVSWSDHGTVYKGTAQYKGSGEWEITPTSEGVDMGDLTYTHNYAGGHHRFTTTLPDIVTGVAGTTPINAISSMYKAVSWSASWKHGDMSYSNGPSATAVTIINDNYSDAATFKTAMAGQTLVYELESPTPFTVTGPDPETLLGDNNIWANTGDISVKYRCNTALYIEKKLGE